MGTKQARQKQEELFYASERTETAGHPFYEQLSGTAGAGDLNGDGVANVLDFQLLVRVVLGIGSCPT